MTNAAHSTDTKPVRILTLFAAVLLSAGCVSHPAPLRQFHGSGLSLEYPDFFTLNYEPNGANRILIFWKEKLIGGIIIQGPPPTDSETEFIESGKFFFQQRYGVTVVDHGRYQTPNQYSFHVFKYTPIMDGKKYIGEHFVHLRPVSSSDAAQAMMEKLSGTFAFDFVIADSDYVSLQGGIETMINTFQLDSLSEGNKQ